MRAEHKECLQIKDVHFSGLVTSDYTCVQEYIDQIIVNKENPDLSPIFDFEL